MSSQRIIDATECLLYFTLFTEVLRFDIRVCVNKCFSLSLQFCVLLINYFFSIQLIVLLVYLRFGVLSLFSLTDSTKSIRRMQTKLAASMNRPKTNISEKNKAIFDSYLKLIA